MSVYHGKGGVAYLSLTAAGAATTVLKLNRWALNQPAPRENVTGFGDTNQQYVQGIPDCIGTLSGFWDDTDDNLYDASRSSDGVKLYLYPTSLVTSKYWYGLSWISFDTIEVSATGPVAVTANFGAKGNWGQL